MTALTKCGGSAGILVTLASTLAGPVLAVDGVIEINQARALAGGVTAGDAPGFPVDIWSAGSYRLTGNLDVSGQANPQNVTAIDIHASFVTLDLNGFELLGPTTCSGTPVTSCAPLGSGKGIEATSANFTRISDGIVRGFGSEGIRTGNASIHRVHAFFNGGHGIFLIAGGLVIDSFAYRNLSTGIAGNGLLVRNSRAQHNGGPGFFLEPGIAEGCAASQNGGWGFITNNGLIVESFARENANCQIHAPGGAFARNVVVGTISVCGGVELGENLCNGTEVCP